MTPGDPTPKLYESEIAHLAYQLWEKAGRPHGRDRHFWFEAEKQLRAKAAKTPPHKPEKN